MLLIGKPSISMGHLYHGYVSHNKRVMGKIIELNDGVSSHASHGADLIDLPQDIRLELRGKAVVLMGISTAIFEDEKMTKKYISHIMSYIHIYIYTYVYAYLYI